MAKSKVVVSLGEPDKDSSTPFTVDTSDEALKQLITLRKWCSQNLTKGWRTYSLYSGGGKQKNFVVFEFDSRKDEMVFKLYTGK